MPLMAMLKQAAKRRKWNGRVALSVLSLPVLTGVLLVSSGCGPSNTNAGAPSASSEKTGGTPTATVQPGAAQSPTDTVQTTLGPSGFTPNQVSHAAGQFQLKVKNQSGAAEVTLRLSDAQGNKVTEAKLTEKVKEWSMPLELAAGSYTLTEVNHSSWTCAVTVTAP